MKRIIYIVLLIPTTIICTQDYPASYEVYPGTFDIYQSSHYDDWAIVPDIHTFRPKVRWALPEIIPLTTQIWSLGSYLGRCGKVSPRRGALFRYDSPKPNKKHSTLSHTVNNCEHGRAIREIDTGPIKKV